MIVGAISEKYSTIGRKLKSKAIIYI